MMYYDSEPLREGTVVPCTTWDILYALRWYNENKTAEDAAVILNTDTATGHRFMTLAWLGRILSRGFDLPEKEQATYLQLMSDFQEYLTNKAAEDAERPKVDIQAVIKSKAMEMLGGIEAEFDTGRVDEWYEVYNKLEIRPVHVPHIIKELQLLKAIAEESMIGRYDNMISDLERISKNKKSAAKTGKRKVIDPDKVVKGLHYLARNDEFKLESVKPERLVGATEVWLFNVKLRQLFRYLVHDGGGLTVKGTTLHNFDPEKSFVRTLRKPEEVLPKILDGTRKQNEKLFENLTTKPLKATGRVNKDCVILRVETK